MGHLTRDPEGVCEDHGLPNQKTRHTKRPQTKAGRQGWDLPSELSARCSWSRALVTCAFFCTSVVLQ